MLGNCLCQEWLWRQILAVFLLMPLMINTHYLDLWKFHGIWNSDLEIRLLWIYNILHITCYELLLFNYLNLSLLFRYSFIYFVQINQCMILIYSYLHAISLNWHHLFSLNLDYDYKLWFWKVRISLKHIGKFPSKILKI